MASKGHNTAARAARKVALMIEAKRDLDVAAELLGEAKRAIEIWASELTTDAENLRQTAIGTQAEAVRLCMSALTVRGASERLNVVAQLVADEGGAQ
ncbi:MAG: hypothetical protein WDO69_05625 [Pseudomonadota bacterium]